MGSRGSSHSVTRVHFARVDEDGKLHLQSPEVFKQAVRAYAGKFVELTVKEQRNRRSDRANRYYFGVVIKLVAEHCGYEPDEMHEALAFRFLRIEDDPVTSSPRRQRTPKTSTKEFAEYVDQCIRFAAELGVYVPQPHEVDI